MCIWRTWDEGSELRVWLEAIVLPPCKSLGLDVWRMGGGGMLLNYQWSEVRLLNIIN